MALATGTKVEATASNNRNMAVRRCMIFGETGTPVSCRILHAETPGKALSGSWE